MRMLYKITIPIRYMVDFFHKVSRECVGTFLHPIGVSLAKFFFSS